MIKKFWKKCLKGYTSGIKYVYFIVLGCYIFYIDFVYQEN